MSIDLTQLDSTRRLLFEVELRPLQGKRFQPTGFPDLGPATYQSGDQACLLLESAQSMANRMEETIWDAAANTPVGAAEGISYVEVKTPKGDYLTSSIVESHRINSPYILEGNDKAFFTTLRKSLEVMESGPIDRQAFANTMLKYDVNSLLHGVFLAKKELAGGRLRLPRALSSFIEAEGVRVVASGGVKNDHVDPQGDAAKGFGNVPFHREEFTADKITAFFNLDLQQIRAYGLGADATRMLTVLALYKIRQLLDGDMRLRTACDLEPVTETVEARKLKSFRLPLADELEVALQTAIAPCRQHMEVTSVTYTK